MGCEGVFITWTCLHDEMVKLGFLLQQDILHPNRVNAKLISGAYRNALEFSHFPMKKH